MSVPYCTLPTRIQPNNVAQRTLTWYGSQSVGSRNSQEDRYSAWTTDNGAVFGVYDGHGGSRMAHALSHGVAPNVSPLHKVIYDYFSAGITNMTLTQAFYDWEKRLYHAKGSHYLKHGSTATCVYCDIQNDTIHVLNVGDSRAAIITQDGNIHTTQDHTAYHERQRILEQGGRIYSGDLILYKHTDGRYIASPIGTTPEFPVSFTEMTHVLTSRNDTPRVGDRGSSRKEPSRSFGDYYRIGRSRNSALKKPTGMTVRPDHYKFTLSQTCAVILATDGIWDSLSNDRVNELVKQTYHHSGSPQEATSGLIQESESPDNKTALVLFQRHS